MVSSVVNGGAYYDFLLNSTEVKDYYDPGETSEKRGITLYKMEIEKITDGYLHDRISDVHIVTSGTCNVADKFTNAILMTEGLDSRMLFFEKGNACGVKEIFMVE